MAQDRYFDKFPIITYNNVSAVDITKRTAVLNSVNKNPYVFYPYDLSNYERPDQFSYRYYGDQYKSWLIYLSNNIVDPYYEWYLQENEFAEFIIKKYGSINAAQNKTIYYKNNWENTDNISISFFDALPDNLKNYYEPEYGVNKKIISYTRKQKNWISNTNRLVTYTVNSNNFILGEVCNIVFGNNHKGTGEIESIVNNTLYVKNTSGYYMSNNDVVITSNSYVYGTESNTTSIMTTSTLQSVNIAPDEEILWAPVSYYEYESAKNEFNKSIRVLDNVFGTTAAKNLKDLMKQ